MRHQKLENKTIECKLENKAIDCQNIEEALHQMEAKYYSMFENAVSGIFHNPNYCAISAINLRFKIRHDALCLQSRNKLSAPIAINVKLIADIS